MHRTPDSGLIGSSSALKAIYCQAIVAPPKSILEFGTGIGTISAFLQKVTSARILTIEKDSRFLEIAKKNVENFHSGGLTGENTIVFESKLSFNKDSSFDWIIIDESVEKSEWKVISKLDGVELFIIENQRFISRFRVLGILLRKKMRFQYSEIDTAYETGIAVFRVNHRGGGNLVLFFLDYLSTFILLLPRFVKGTYRDRGKNLFINKE
jgi:protein-L-isoaspartate O-methyltransferase